MWNGVRMDTKIYVIDRDDVADNNGIYECAKIISQGGLVAFPTETVYGLGGNALDGDVSGKIYAAKGRPSDNPLIVHIAELDTLYDLVEEVPESALALAKKYWPGPLTMIFKKKDIIPDTTTGGLDTVAVRMPSHPVANAFIRAAGVPIAAPSANLSGKPSPTRASHVVDDLSGRIDAIIDSGAVDIGLESTIIDFTGKVPVILRPGYIDQKMLEEVVGSVERDPTLDRVIRKYERPKAPGMMYRHYAPKGELKIVDGAMEAVIEAINGFAALYDKNEVVVITTKDNEGRYTGCVVLSIGERSDEYSIAKELYSALRKMDELNIKHIYVESFEGGQLGDAIMNRLKKAAGYRVIHIG